MSTQHTTGVGPRVYGLNFPRSKRALADFGSSRTDFDDWHCIRLVACIRVEAITQTYHLGIGRVAYPDYRYDIQIRF